VNISTPIDSVFGWMDENILFFANVSKNHQILEKQ
jgi:hypothetical protein